MDRSAVLNLPAFQHSAIAPFPFQSPLAGIPGGLVYCPPMMPTAPAKPPLVSEQQAIPDEDEPPKAKRLPMDKHLKRQIANSNERKRMQSINTGFVALRAQMPHIQGEKLSKAAILQHAADSIYHLSHEKTKLISENAALKMLAAKHGYLDQANSVESPSLQAKVNKATSPIVCTQEDFDEDKQAAEEMEQIYAAHEELEELRRELDRERRARMYLEQENLLLQQQLESLDGGSQSGKQEVSRRNLDLMLKAIRQIEGDAFSRPATPRDAPTPVKSGFTSPRSMVR